MGHGVDVGHGVQVGRGVEVGGNGVRVGNGVEVAIKSFSITYGVDVGTEESTDKTFNSCSMADNVLLATTSSASTVYISVESKEIYVQPNKTLLIIKTIKIYIKFSVFFI